MEKNKQATEAKDTGTGAQLDVHSIFYTIQGEGPYAGRPATFIRLAGCNLQCPGCDTEYTATRGRYNVSDIMEQVEDSNPNVFSVNRLAVITGGEPFRQNVTKLAYELIRARFLVQFETNGTFEPPIGFPPECRVICSPKTGKVAPGLLRHVYAYKYVLEADRVNAADGLPTSILGGVVSPARPPVGYKGVIYVSPMDSQDPAVNGRNTNAAVQSCLEFGYTLNLQIHKLVGLP